MQDKVHISVPLLKRILTTLDFPNVYGMLKAKILEESLTDMLQVFLFVASYQSSCWTRWAERRCSKYGGRESTEAAMGSVPGLRCPNIHRPHTLSTKTQKSALLKRMTQENTAFEQFSNILPRLDVFVTGWWQINLGGCGEVEVGEGGGRKAY